MFICLIHTEFIEFMNQKKVSFYFAKIRSERKENQKIIQQNKKYDFFFENSSEKKFGDIS